MDTWEISQLLLPPGEGIHGGLSWHTELQTEDYHAKKAVDGQRETLSIASSSDLAQCDPRILSAL